MRMIMGNDLSKRHEKEEKKVTLVKRRSPRTRNVLRGDDRDLKPLQEIEVVNVEEFTALVHNYLTSTPLQMNPRATKRHKKILDAIQKAIPDADTSVVKLLAQGVGSAFMAENAENAAFLTLLQQVFAAASAAVSFRQLASLCCDKYVADRRRKLGKDIGPTELAALIQQPGLKSVVFRRMKEANDTACNALGKSNVHPEKNFVKCVGVGQFIIDLVDMIGPGVAFRFFRESNLSYSSLQTMTTGKARNLYVARLQKDPHRQTCRDVYSSSHAAEATEKAWKDLGFK
ncbi:hypothetical protein DFS34DRAFT_605103 [Phlyctochytrium arcticum]|nr:hypothetical protein DFS34DRAFT_605103 [Phlyctochytrium arcticum]